MRRIISFFEVNCSGKGQFPQNLAIGIIPSISLITLRQRHRQLNPILDWHKSAAAKRPFAIRQRISR